ncbi:MAG TPA: phosphoribosylanthranilate isomerase [Chloroflexi bacterium]|nr:phosphoribosylanthranilate isomerase [Chloroflexota bacterium]
MSVVKICGTTNLEDALVAVEAGADLLGFILYPKSPRYVAPETVAEIVAGVRAATGAPPRCVGVFVNTPPGEVSGVLAQTGLDLAQLHGDEPAEALAALRGRGFKAVRPTGLEDALALAEKYGASGGGDGPDLLIDAYAPHAYGGTGQRADWAAAAAVAQRVPRLLLAGGLTPDNVAAAVATVMPWGVDVASGVELAPGRKDHAKVRAFVAAAKGALTPGA